MGHNFYQQRGGEDESFTSEANLLEHHGHAVERYTVHNDSVNGMHPLTAARKTLWNDLSARELGALFAREHYDVAHFQNTFPLLSPAVYYAASDAGVPVIQSLRNYRLTCVNGLLFRDGRVCEDCLTKFAPWDGVLHGCYRGSRAASAVVTSMLAFHRLRGTFTHMVDVYIALTEFSKGTLVRSGVPAEKIEIKPNFVAPDPGVGDGRGAFALFVGRLSPEKGIRTLLKAWATIGHALPLKIVGDGPEREALGAIDVPGVTWLGRKSIDEVHALMGAATLVVFPSEWYETFGRVAIEAFAKGTPVVAADIGAVGELVEHGRTGSTFRAGDAAGLAAAVTAALENPSQWQAMRGEARAEFLAKYTAERNYERLIAIYERAKERASARA